MQQQCIYRHSPNNLLPYLNALAKKGVSEIIFQQDNASCHVSNKTRAWFIRATNEHRFSIMDWPPNSPDMNLIKNLWAYPKAALHKRYPDQGGCSCGSGQF